MMANGWKTPEDIQRDYQLKKSAFYTWVEDCKLSPFADAIVKPTGRKIYIVEPEWQKFIVWKSEKREQEMLDPHIRKGRFKK